MRTVPRTELAIAGPLLETAGEALLAPLVSPPLTAHEAAGLDLILEGFLLHHGRPRHLEGGGGREVLAGDYCYAFGLVRIAASGDLFVVEALANLIALGAGLVAAGEREALTTLWRATTAVIAARRAPDADAVAGRFLAAQRHLRADGDAAPLAELAALLAPTPALAEAFAA